MSSAYAQEKRYLAWNRLPDLPDVLGVAGAFVGVHKDALIVAGGANFSRPIWDSEKQWHDRIWVLTGKTESTEAWRDAGALPCPVGYGAAVSTPKGVVCIGGNHGDRFFSTVFRLAWNPDKQTVDREPLPPLPDPCAFGAAALIGKVIYVAGGQRGPGLAKAMNNFWALDLSRSKEEDFGWQRLPPWPGPARAFNIVVAQHNGKSDCIYVMSGRRMVGEGDDGPVDFLQDVHEFSPARYDPQAYDAETGRYRGTYRQAHPWIQKADAPSCVMAGAGVALGQSHVFILSGADGALFHQADALKDDHPGFPKKAWAYHTITDTWISAGKTPINQVTTIPVAWRGDIVLASGEVRPRVRTPEVWRISAVSVASDFGLLNLGVIVVYLLAVTAVGIYFSFRNRTTEDFFRGGQRVPWWAAGLSIFATMLSSITFVAIPAKAYATNWVFFLFNMTIVLTAPFIVIWVLPFFRRLDVTSAYEYLEVRFNVGIRLFASFSFTLFQIGRMAIVMYLPALALAAITPLSVVQCILLMGGLSIIYCTMGGLEAVIWTDTIQSFILLGGALLSFLVIVLSLEGGFGEFFSTAWGQEKFHLIDLDWDFMSFTTTALWVVVLGGIGQNLVPYVSDQAVVQRYMATSDAGRAAKAIWTNAFVCIPASLLFFGVGTALFVFYKAHPAELDPTFKTDGIFPLFIARHLPPGIAGLVVAGIFAAAQSTISTSMNSLSTTLVTDFIRRFKPGGSERFYLGLARVLTLAAGCLGTGLAVLFAVSDIHSAWELFMKVLGLFGGAMCGLFMLGMFTRRANAGGALVGAFLGALGLFLVQVLTPLHGLLYAAVSIGICFVTGYCASFFFSHREAGQ